MGESIASRIISAASIVLILIQEGHVGVTSLQKADLKDLIRQSNVIVKAEPLKPFERKETITFSDSAGKIPPFETKAYRFKRLDVLVNSSSMDLPDTLIVFDYYAETLSRGHLLAHTTGLVESPVTQYYESPIKEGKLSKEKSVILFLTVNNADPVASPNRWLQFSAINSYEKPSKAKAIGKLLPKTQSPIRPKLSPQPNYPARSN
jgi:hypothetical protein